MQIIIDTWWEYLIASGTILGSLFIIYCIIKLILNNGGIKMKNFNLGKNKPSKHGY